jgi:hypothetical protein
VGIDLLEADKRELEGIQKQREIEAERERIVDKLMYADIYDINRPKFIAL